MIKGVGWQFLTLFQQLTWWGDGGWLEGTNVKATLGELNVNNNNHTYRYIYKPGSFVYCLAFTLFIRKVNYIVEECLCFKSLSSRLLNLLEKSFDLLSSNAYLFLNKNMFWAEPQQLENPE